MFHPTKSGPVLCSAVATRARVVTTSTVALGLTMVLSGAAFSNPVSALEAAPTFTSWAKESGYQVVSGDFNGDGKTDLAMTGAESASTVPVAFSNGNGTFRVTNLAVPGFTSWAKESGYQVVAGDFNGDGKTDLAMTGAHSATTVPVAFSNGNGTFRVTNLAVPGFTTWAKESGYQVAAGDINHDGKTDLAMTGAESASTVPVAFSNGNGSFVVTNARL